MDIKQMTGARIKEITTKKGITQEQLSEMMEINPKYLSSFEQGKKNPPFSTLIKLSESLEVDLGEIFSFVDPEDRNRLKSQIISLLDEADSEQLKMILKVLSVIIH